ncbi:MAG: leucine-rich repeat protein [Lachnospiraceae bacterium]|nr:leucine-rich repeat protein [Lachnospiraceae bacterium]
MTIDRKRTEKRTGKRKLSVLLSVIMLAAVTLSEAATCTLAAEMPVSEVEEADSSYADTQEEPAPEAADTADTESCPSDEIEAVSPEEYEEEEETVFSELTDDDAADHADEELIAAESAEEEVEENADPDGADAVPANKSDEDWRKYFEISGTRISKLTDDGKKLSSIVIPDSFGITQIDADAFSGAKAQSITLPATLKIIRARAFRECANLKSITIPAKVTTIGDYAFADCTSLGKVTFEGLNITSDGQWIFQGCAIKNLTLPQGATRIPANLFHCAKFSSCNIVIPKTVSIIEYGAFWHAYGYSGFEFEEGSQLKTIGEGAFAAYPLASIDLPDSLREIYGSAFQYAKLTSITLPAGLKILKGAAFDACPITEVTILGSSLEDDWWRDGVFARTAISKLNIAEGVTNIPQYLFQHADFDNCRIVFPSTLEEIKAGAFAYSNGIIEVDFSKCTRLKSIRAEAFCQVGSLQCVRLPYGLKTIGYDAFGRSGLTDITIPETVTSIGDWAFVNLPAGAVFHVVSGSYAHKWVKNLISSGSRYELAVCYGIKYVLNGGTNVPANISTYDEGESFTFAEPTKSGCRFDAWCTDKNLKNPITNTGGCKSNLTLYAKWTPYNVVLSESEIYMTVGEEVVLTATVTPNDKSVNFYKANISANAVSVVNSADNQATVTAKNPGTEIIRADLFNGKEAQCRIVVVADDTGGADKPDRYDSNNIWMTGIDPAGYTYTGSAIKPAVKVYDYKHLLTPGKDYTVTYVNNTKVNNASVKKKAPAVTVKLKGSYSGSMTEYFRINPAVMSDQAVTDEVFIAKPVSAAVQKDKNGKSAVQKLKPVIIYEGKKLKEKKDYVLSYEDAGAEGTRAYADAGEYGITVKPAKGSNFTGSFTVKETLYESAEDIYVSLTSKQVTATLSRDSITYGDELPALELTYKASADAEPYVLTKDTDYTVTEMNTAAAGTASYVITAKEKLAGEVYFTGMRTVTFKIKQGAASDFVITVNGGAPVTYVKGGVTPEVTVSYKDEPLVEGRDYKISYSNNKSLAKGKKKPTVKITATGNYKGSRSIPFEILPGQINELQGPKNCYIENIAYSSQKNGYKKAKVFIFDENGAMLKKGTDYTVTFTSPAGSKPAAGTDISVKITGKGNYAGSSFTATMKIMDKGKTINKAAITYRGYDGGKVSSYAYTGYEVIPDRIELTQGKGKKASAIDVKNYNIMGYYNNVSKGTATVIIRGDSGYGWGGLMAYTYKIGARTVKR